MCKKWSRTASLYTTLKNDGNLATVGLSALSLGHIQLGSSKERTMTVRQAEMVNFILSKSQKIKVGRKEDKSTEWHNTGRVGLDFII